MQLAEKKISDKKNNFVDVDITKCCYWFNMCSLYFVTVYYAFRVAL